MSSTAALVAAFNIPAKYAKPCSLAGFILPDQSKSALEKEFMQLLHAVN